MFVLQVWNGRPVADAAITTVDGALAACILRVYVAGAEMPALRLELATVARCALRQCSCSAYDYVCAL